MSNVELIFGSGGKGTFIVSKNKEQIAEMSVAVKEGILTVYHTEVVPEFEGQGLATLLLNYMAEYARSEQLKVVALCSFVLMQFKRNPDEYRDIWKQ